MDGTLTGSGALVGSPARLDLAGDLALDHVTIYGKPLKGVRGRVEGSGREESMVLRELNADMCGGRATGEVQLFYGDDDSRYDVAATLADVDLAQFLNAGRPPDDRIEDVSGRMHAHLFMGLAGGDPRDRRGGGRVLVREGQLYRLPLVTAIQGEARIRPPDESALQELTGAFFIAGPQVELQDIVLQGPGLALIGAGELSPSDGALDLTLVAVSPRNWVKVPVITEFLEGAARELVEINVRGTVSEPHIATRPLRGVEAALETLFQGRNAPKQR
jgi:hypothetical protein